MIEPQRGFPGLEAPVLGPMPWGYEVTQARPASALPAVQAVCLAPLYP